MASLVTHAALPLIVRRAFALPEAVRTRLLVLSALCACAPDLDILGYAFGVRDTELLGHRGLFHSVPFAAVLALGVALLAFRSLGLRSRAFWAVAGFLFGSVAAHGLVDALTAGDVGIALLAPFTSRRWLFPLHLLPVVPLGVPEYFGRWGALVLANEAVFLLAPVALLAAWRRRREARVLLAVTAVAWAGIAVSLRRALPGLFTPTLPRVLLGFGPPGSSESPSLIPLDGLPGGRLVTRLSELERLGLLDQTLEAAPPPWSSSFFPAWYGGAAGRWQDGTLTLIERTLTGVRPPEESEVRSRLAAGRAGDPSAARWLFRLSPVEKMDLVMGRVGLSSERKALVYTHNGHPRFWYGLCSGVATAASEEPEPFRTVDVTGPGGTIRFHPNDAKGLLAMSYYWTEDLQIVGGFCATVRFDAGRVCSMNPGGFVLTALNRLGLAHRSFLMDAVPTMQAQYYAIARASVRKSGVPYPPPAELDPSLAGRVAELQDVAIDVVGSSTTLGYAAADRVDPAFPDGAHYRPVGLVPVPFHYDATLALAADGEILGGKWNGDPGNGPDNVVFPVGGPLLRDGGTGLEVDPDLDWRLIHAIAAASADGDGGTPTVDALTLLDAGVP